MKILNIFLSCFYAIIVAYGLLLAMANFGGLFAWLLLFLILAIDVMHFKIYSHIPDKSYESFQSQSLGLALVLGFMVYLALTDKSGGFSMFIILPLACFAVLIGIAVLSAGSKVLGKKNI